MIQGTTARPQSRVQSPHVGGIQRLLFYDVAEYYASETLSDLTLVLAVGTAEEDGQDDPPAKRQRTSVVKPEEGEGDAAAAQRAHCEELLPGHSLVLVGCSPVFKVGCHGRLHIQAMQPEHASCSLQPCLGVWMWQISASSSAGSESRACVQCTPCLITCSCDMATGRTDTLEGAGHRAARQQQATHCLACRQPIRAAGSTHHGAVHVPAAPARMRSTAAALGTAAAGRQVPGAGMHSGLCCCT